MPDSYKAGKVRLNGVSEKRALADVKYLTDHYAQRMETWADQDLDIDLTPAEMAERMRKNSPNMTMSVLSSVYSPIAENGFKVSSFVGMLVLHSAVEKMNPNFNMDVARLEMSLISRANDIDHPRMGRLERALRNDCAARMGREIDEHLRNHNMDAVVMTPVQLAAVKLSFDKQAYVKYRKCKTSEEISAVEKTYNRAITTLKSVAQNSGFDMSVVAAEERYMVGLKIKNNPDFANMYAETYNMGVEPDFNYDKTGSKRTRIWSGVFKTVDGGDYTVGENKDTGAFTPRKPFGEMSTRTPQSVGLHDDIDPRKRIADQFVIRAKEWGGAMRFIQSEDCKFSTSMKRTLSGQINTEMEKYRDRMLSAMLDDRIFRTAAEGRKIWNDSFVKTYDAMIGLDDANIGKVDIEYGSGAKVLGIKQNLKDSNGNTIEGYFDSQGNFVDGPLTTRNTYSQAMRDELKRIVVKEVLDSANIDYGKGTAMDMLRVRHEIGEHYKRVFVQNGKDWREDKRMQDVDTNLDGKVRQDIFGQRMLDELVEKRMASMTANEALELVRHAIVNVDQGCRRRNNVPGRIREEDWLTNNKTYDELMNGAYVEAWRVKKASSTDPDRSSDADEFKKGKRGRPRKQQAPERVVEDPANMPSFEDFMQPPPSDVDLSDVNDGVPPMPDDEDQL